MAVTTRIKNQYMFHRESLFAFTFHSWVGGSSENMLKEHTNIVSNRTKSKNHWWQSSLAFSLKKTHFFVVWWICSKLNLRQGGGQVLVQVPFGVWNNMKVNGCGDSKRHLATVDGSEIRRENHLGCKKTLVKIRDILHINWFAGFLPSILCLDLPFLSSDPRIRK